MSDSAEFSAGARDPVAPDAATSAVSPTKARRYRAFISYSHVDTPWANWLLKKLEGYRVPARFHGCAAPVGDVGPRLAPVFRDRDELPTTSALGETIRAALRESATLIVICSPSSAKSRWVQEEIIAFKRLRGERRVFALIVAGEPKAEGTADDCFPPALRRELGPDGTLTGAPAEVVAADARPHADGKSTAFVRLVAGLLGVGFDELRQRELQRRNRRLTLIAAAAVVGMVLTLGLALAAWRARGDAQRRQDQAEDVLAFMLGDFREDLKKVGQLALLEKVGNKAQAYFDAADPRDLTDTALARQARALAQIGEVRMEKANFSEAERAFQNAFDRASALARRHPDNGNMLFERAQAEFWLAFVAWKRGEMPRARQWSTQYRDSAAALVAREKNSVRAQRELISAHHNLAMLEFDEGNYSAARLAFLAEDAQVRGILAARPDELSLRLKRADIASRLGLIEDYSGDFGAALERFGESCAQARGLVALEPAVARWRVTLAISLTLTANVQAIAGRGSEASSSYAEAKTIFHALAVQDPKNQQWRMRVATVELNEVALLAAAGRGERAAEILREARATIEKLVAAEPSSQAFTRLLAKAWRLEASIPLTAHGPDAESAAGRAVEMGETLLRQQRGDDSALAELALARIVAGRICEANGADKSARGIGSAHWRSSARGKLRTTGGFLSQRRWRWRSWSVTTKRRPWPYDCGGLATTLSTPLRPPSWMPRLNDQSKPNNMPNNYMVNVTVTVTAWPGNQGDITAYSMAITDADTPANFLSCDTTGHFIAAMTSSQAAPPPPNPPRFISGPVSPGDKITFVFSGSTGFTVTDIGGLNGLAGGLAWGQKSTADGTTSITATVTAAPVTAVTTHTEYSVVMQKAIAGSPPTFETATIDPDFETDVT